jgi:hypothetical protein
MPRKSTPKQSSPAKRPPIAKEVTSAAMTTMAKLLEGPDKEGTREIRELAAWILAERAKTWSAEVVDELTAVVTEATEKAISGWKKREREFEKEIIRAVVRTRTEKKMTEWAGAAVEQVEAEVDERNLISTDVLRESWWMRPARKNESDRQPRRTDAYECLDKEFLDWFLGQLGEKGLNSSNRLHVRMLLIASLAWLKDDARQWRYPRLGEFTVQKGGGSDS